MARRRRGFDRHLHGRARHRDRQCVAALHRRQSRRQRRREHLGGFDLSDRQRRHPAGKRLAVECEDDPILAAEARYAIAVAYETLTIEAPNNLDKAVTEYQQVAKLYEKTAHGQQAKERLKVLAFKITDKSLASLRVQEVPTEVLSKLEALKDKEFARPAFAETLATSLQKKEFEDYGFLILREAQDDPGSWNRVQTFYMTFGQNVGDPQAQFQRALEEHMRKLENK